MFGFLKRLFGKADVNKDGRVDSKDAKVVAEAVTAKAEVAAAKVKKQAAAGAAKVKIARAKRAKPAAKA